MRIKICGITRAEDARAAGQAGADLLGFNFYPPSPRYVGDGPLEELLSAVEPPAVPVAVTVNAEPGLLEALTRPGRRVGRRPFAVVQMHGNEAPGAADRLIDHGVKVIKAFRVGGDGFCGAIREWLTALRRPGGVLAVLLDAPPPRVEQYGGSGRVFDWEWIVRGRAAGELDGLPPMLLAGGLTPANVAEAVRLARPWGVDVAGGVESAPGVKSVAKMRNFIRNARVG